MIAYHQMESTLSRKMIFLPIFLLFVVSALAGEYKNSYGQPIDYFDDDFQSNLKIGPDSTFSFNFEQTRRDQPPQKEMREENVGRYFHTKPQTTTAAPTHLFSMNAEKESQHVYPTMIEANNYHHQQHWNQPQVSPVPPPPKFAFSRPHNNQPSLPKNPVTTWNNAPVHQNPHPSNIFNNYPVQVPSSPKPISHGQWIEPARTHSTPSPYVASNQPKGFEDIRFAPSASYISDSISNNGPPQPPSLPKRGSHKFSWDDIKNEKAIVKQPQATSTPKSIYNKPPPPVPTLSPWYDNFGK